MPELDMRQLSAAIHAKRGERALREIAEEITQAEGSVSASTLCRIEQGLAPDLDTFVRLCRWLGESSDRFILRGGPDEQRRERFRGLREEVRRDLCYPRHMLGKHVALIDFMQEHGSSLIMNWGEDPDPTWEVSWITGGERYTGVRLTLPAALLESADKAAKAIDGDETP